jgi:threonine dehydratase
MNDSAPRQATLSPPLAELEAAQRRLRGRVRTTPLFAPAPLREPATAGELLLKLECLQVTGSFKARGALNASLTLPTEARKRGLVTASGGNHGLAVAWAGWAAGVPTTVYLPRAAPKHKAEGIAAWGARVEIVGEVWDDANEAALAAAAASGAAYLHPFADARVIAGQASLGLEILDQDPDIDVLVVAIGGGGLISGIALAAHARRPGLRVVGVEPVGAPTLEASIRAGRVVELERLDTAANTLAPRRSAEINFDIVRQHVERIVLVEDDAMRDAARWLWRECGIAAELSGAAAVAAVRLGLVPLAPTERVCVLVCGAGRDGMGQG